jgi:ABC-type hemin transport system substrate-binding protein
MVGPGSLEESMEKVPVLVSVDRKSNNTIVDQLRSAGLDVARAMPRLGVVSGSADEQAMEAIRRVGGVLHVERAGGIQLTPPDSPIQ